MSKETLASLKKRYAIFATYDRAKIQAETGEEYANLGEVHAEASKLAKAIHELDPAFLEADACQAMAELENKSTDN
jgi:hypothetical protein